MMKVRERAAAGFLAACLFGLFASSLKANLINGGGFEQPVAGPGGFESGALVFTVGQTFDSAWTVTGSSSGNVAITPDTETDIGGVEYLAEEGSQSLDLTGSTDNGSATGVEQSFATTSGAQYTLSFYLGDVNNAAYAPHSGAASVLVELNGSLFQTATNSNSSGLTPDWEQYSYTFTATGATTTLEFINNVGAGLGYNGLDNVVVTGATATPEPASLVLLVTGTALLPLTRKRRRHS